jgi:hypothetical protein
MAKKPAKKNKRSKKRAVRKIEPAVTTLNYDIDYSQVGVDNYISISRDLSNLNRRLYRQGMQYAIAGITVSDDVGSTRDIEINVSTAGNTWIVHNAWKKGQALWMEMQKNVLDSNPSVAGKWRDYKVLMTEEMAFSNTARALTGSMSAWPAGQEWTRSLYVVPQHEVDAAGQPLPAEEWYACLIGPDDPAQKIFSLVKAYEESRATVQQVAPNVPGTLPNSFYLKLQDDGSQDPELATVIIDENDQPPYATAYPGGEAFGVKGAMTRVGRGTLNSNAPTLQMPGFTAECGFIYLNAKSATDVTGNVRVQVHLVPGEYKGVLAVPMGQ